MNINNPIRLKNRELRLTYLLSKRSPEYNILFNSVWEEINSAKTVKAMKIALHKLNQL